MRKHIILLSLLFATSTLFAEISSIQKNALVDFFYATNGASWNNPWDLDQNPDTWQGVTIENGNVVGISLLFNNLSGNLPTSLGDLSELKTLELSFNKISGDLPASLGKLIQLEVLAINGNQLKGTIPSSIGQLNQLKQLHLSSNQLEGSIPAELASLSALEILNLFDNDLSGQVPNALVNCKNLKQVLLAENNLSTDKKFSVVVLNAGAQLDLEPIENTLDTGIVNNGN